MNNSTFQINCMKLYVDIVQNSELIDTFVFQMNQRREMHGGQKSDKK